MKVKIRKSDPNVCLPVYGTKDAAAFDIASNEDVIVKPKEIKLIHTGLFFQCPPGYFLAIFSRSSTPITKGLMFPHSVGILDPDYSGPEDEALILVYNFIDKPVEIKKGDRIAQGMFLPMQQVSWEETDTLKEKTRGGFGSTGN
ncbi:MAG: dUTP diphosphatase [Candidatus Doudnabacteria bacterium]|nr:dUTP diphosphatase [Candidatus Doudnabacteria bacterium]